MLRLKQIGETQAYIAREMGINPQTITKWLDRQSIPSRHLVELCGLLKCSVDWLLSGSEVISDETPHVARLMRYLKSGRIVEEDVIVVWPLIERMMGK